MKYNIEKVEFSPTTKYKIGAVTFQVAAFFNAEKEPVDEKIKNLIVKKVQNNSICTFVSQSGVAVK